MKKKQVWLVCIFIFSTTLFISASYGSADPNCDDGVAQALSVQGKVESRLQLGWVPVTRNATFCPGELIRVGQYGRAVIRLKNDQVNIKLDQNSSLTLPIQTDSSSVVRLHDGDFHIISSAQSAIHLQTRHVNSTFKETEFFCSISEPQTLISVKSGRADLNNANGSLVIRENQTASTDGTSVPALVMQFPFQSTQWALYYPLVVDLREMDLTGMNKRWIEIINSAIKHYYKGDIVSALHELALIVDDVNDFRIHNIQATMLLSVGRALKAQVVLASAQQHVKNSTTFALRAMIALVNKQPDNADRFVRLALEYDDKSISAILALSYLNQADHNLGGALKASQNAVRLNPTSSIAWARLAEMHLSFDKLDLALEAVQKSLELDSRVAHAHTVLGFIWLSAKNTDKAMLSFQDAISLDQSAPLPHVGMGLALVQTGDNKLGKIEFELAASLAPFNGIFRSYLGKMYFSEQYIRAAEQQIETAKILNHDDPTPWLYNAFIKQSENRPVEALLELQQSIKRNSNGALFRSELRLDQDLATSGAGLAGIYKDLHFENVALNTGWKSTTMDNSNYSAHRLLADLYKSVPRHEIARVSELLQAQLLQPMNLFPVQAYTSVSRLGILESAGLISVSNGEYSPLFVSNNNTIQVNGLAGTQNIIGNDVSFSGVHDNVTYSASQFHYQINGIRENYYLTEDIYNAFVQVVLSPKSHIQMEIRNRYNNNGDLSMKLDAQDFSLKDKHELNSSLWRFGHHYSPSSNSDVLTSIFYQDGRKTLHLENASDTTFFDIDSENKTYSGEIRYLQKFSRFDVSTGLGYGDTSDVENILESEKGNNPFPIDPKEIDSTSKQLNAYFYAYINYWRKVLWTIGMSFNRNDYKNGIDASAFIKQQFNPKLGMLWNPLPSTTIRASAFQVLTRNPTSDQTVEDTHIAGFNQFYDDKSGADSKRFGIAVDQTIAAKIFTGIELSWRALNVPLDEYAGQEKLSESHHKAYVSWAPLASVSFSLESRYELFLRKKDPPDVNLPKELVTYDSAFKLNYFHAQGWIATYKHVFVNQSVKHPSATKSNDTLQETESFNISSFSLAYRFKKRRGKIDIGVYNIFNAKFGYHNLNFQTDDVLDPRFLPHRMLFTKLTFLW